MTVLVLLIDDDALVRRMVRRLLERAGYSVLEAEDGNIALKLLRQHRPAIVITDIIMPRVEGIEIIQEIRRTAPATRIIAISGGGPRGEMMYLDWAQALGADAVLQKPFQPQELLARVEPAGMSTVPSADA